MLKPNCCFRCDRFSDRCPPEHQMTVKMVNQCRDFLPDGFITSMRVKHFYTNKYKLKGQEDAQDK